MTIANTRGPDSDIVLAGTGHAGMARETAVAEFGEVIAATAAA